MARKNPAGWTCSCGRENNVVGQTTCLDCGASRDGSHGAVPAPRRRWKTGPGDEHLLDDSGRRPRAVHVRSRKNPDEPALKWTPHVDGKVYGASGKVTLSSGRVVEVSLRVDAREEGNVRVDKATIGPWNAIDDGEGFSTVGEAQRFAKAWLRAAQAEGTLDPRVPRNIRDMGPLEGVFTRKNPSDPYSGAKRRGMYMTTFCNHAHDVRTGRPIDHECYYLNTKALQAEMDGDYDLANKIGIVKEPRRMVKGRARKNPDRSSNDDSEDALTQARRAIRPDKQRSRLRAVSESRFDRTMRGYFDAALWASTDDDGTPLDAEFSTSDFPQSAKDRAEEDVNLFIVQCEERNIDVNAHDPEQFGHDFWLTRNRHGTGFWDRDLGSEGKILTDIAHSFGEVDIYVGDDGLLYFSR